METTASAVQPSKRRLAPLVSVAAVAVALLAAIASTENEPTKVDESGSGNGGDSAEEGTEDTESPQEFTVGDLVELGDWQVRVHQVTDPLEPPDDFLTPSEGNRWVAVDVEVTNVSDEAGNVSSLLCFELQDSENIEYQQTITGATDAATPDGEVPPGGSRRGTVEYEVPADAEGLRVNFKCDLLSTGSATIAL